MEARAEDLTNLLQLQQVDIELLRTRKQYDALPQRAQIQGIDQKLADIEAKRAQVESLKKDADRRLFLIQDEDERLAARQQDTQERIDGSKADYRSVEALTKDLSGIMKRRATLEEEHDEATERVDHVNRVLDQVNSALNTLLSQKKSLSATLEEEGGVLTRVMAQLEEKRDGFRKKLPDDLLKLYDKAAARSAGIGVAKLEAERCGACRSEIAEGRLLQVKSEAPLSSCPVCKRLLVVAE